MTNADKFRSMTDEELADSRIGKVKILPFSRPFYIALDIEKAVYRSKHSAFKAELEYLKANEEVTKEDEEVTKEKQKMAGMNYKDMDLKKVIDNYETLSKELIENSRDPFRDGFYMRVQTIILKAALDYFKKKGDEKTSLQEVLLLLNEEDFRNFVFYNTSFIYVIHTAPEYKEELFENEKGYVALLIKCLIEKSEEE